jgi:hypothetical protein
MFSHCFTKLYFNIVLSFIPVVARLPERRAGHITQVGDIRNGKKFSSKDEL